MRGQHAWDGIQTYPSSCLKGITSYDQHMHTKQRMRGTDPKKKHTKGSAIQTNETQVTGIVFAVYMYMCKAGVRAFHLWPDCTFHSSFEEL